MEVSATTTALAKANNEFGFELLQQLSGGCTGKNVFISPVSIAMALAMTSCGASPNVREIMSKVLHHDLVGSEEEMKLASKKMLERVKATQDVDLSIANSAWPRGDAVKEEYLQVVRTMFDGEVQPLTGPEPINQFCAEKTHGMIKKVIEQVERNCMLILVNAVYFKGKWTTKFNSDLTKTADFTNSLGDKQNVAMMSQKREDFMYKDNRAEGFQMIELEYGSGGSYSAYVLLPDEGISIEQFVSKLSVSCWQEWVSSLTKKKGTLFIPRIKFEFGPFELSDVLKNQGMGPAFGANAFDRMGQDIRMSSVVHKTVIDLDEEGTRAAAVTVVKMRCLAVGPSREFTMRVNRPFLFVIGDKGDGSILFVGKVENPQN